jgi:hypothetical protein
VQAVQAARINPIDPSLTRRIGRRRATYMPIADPDAFALRPVEDAIARQHRDTTTLRS